MPLAVHQDALGPVDRFALGELALRLGEIGLEPREGVEALDRQVDHRADAVRMEPVDDIGRNARIDRRADRLIVGLVDEHRDRAGERAADREIFLEHVARGIAEVDQHDVGRDRLDPGDAGPCVR